MDTSIAAKVAFVDSLSKLQALLEPVSKDSTNPHFKSKYASLGAVNQAVMGPLTAAGFSVMAGGVDIGGKPYLRTTISHVKGHSESFDYPIVNDGNPQHIASSVTYARRYALCALLNLSVEDDDGNAATPAKVERKPEPSAAAKQTFPAKDGVISEAQGKRFYAIAKKAGKTDEAMKAYLHSAFGVTRTDAIPRGQYDAACEWAAKTEEAAEELEPTPF